MNCVKVRGDTPFTAFYFDALIISLSTAIGSSVKQAYDRYGDSDAGGFFLYLCIVFLAAFVLHVISFFCFSFGGGMLASRKREVVPSLYYFWTGKAAGGEEVQTMM